MNFLKELKKQKSYNWSIFNSGKKMEFVHFDDIENVWRSFWLKRKEEIEEGINHLAYCKRNGLPYSQQRIDFLYEELSWIEKQLKEKEVKRK